MVKLVGFVVASIVWWAMDALAVMITIVGPCGMGPDATCAATPEYQIWLIIPVAIVGYAALIFLFTRRRIR